MYSKFVEVCSVNLCQFASKKLQASKKCREDNDKDDIEDWLGRKVRLVLNNLSFIDIASYGHLRQSTVPR
jgi:hypothetical protein